MWGWPWVMAGLMVMCLSKTCCRGSSLVATGTSTAEITVYVTGQAVVNRTLARFFISNVTRQLLPNRLQVQPAVPLNFALVAQQHRHDGDRDLEPILGVQAGRNLSGFAKNDKK